MKNLLLVLLTVFMLSVSNAGYSQLANSNMTLLRSLDTHPSYSAIWGYLAPNGKEYAIVGGYDGTIFYDVTDSATIREVDFLPSTDPSSSQNSWREMKTYSHYAYIVSEVANSGIQIVDLQYLPDSIRYVGKFTLPNHTKTHSISQSGPYLYLHGANSGFGQGVVVVNVTNPEVPVKMGGWNTRYVHDSRIVNDTIYAMNINSGDGQITVINAVNKNSLTTVTQWLNNPNPSPHNCAITNDRKYLLATDEVGTLPRLLKIWNIQDLMNPSQIATWQPTGITGSRVHNVEIYGNYALIAHYTAGVRLVNISNPAAPVEVAWYDTRPQDNGSNYSGCWGVYMFPSGKIIASDIGNGLFVLKTSVNVITGIDPVNEIPANYSLEQNYPNPFNPSTSISFSLPNSVNVSLEVFNLAGQKVADLLNGVKDAGNHTVKFDAGEYGLSSGVYFYKLKAGEFTETKKMILIQ